MDFFSYTKTKNGKKLGIIHGGLWCCIMNIHNNKLVHMMPKANKGKHSF